MLPVNWDVIMLMGQNCDEMLQYGDGGRSRMKKVWLIFFFQQWWYKPTFTQNIYPSFMHAYYLIIIKSFKIFYDIPRNCKQHKTKQICWNSSWVLQYLSHPWTIQVALTCNMRGIISQYIYIYIYTYMKFNQRYLAKSMDICCNIF